MFLKLCAIYSLLLYAVGMHIWIEDIFGDSRSRSSSVIGASFALVLVMLPPVIVSLTVLIK